MLFSQAGEAISRHNCFYSDWPSQRRTNPNRPKRVVRADMEDPP